jgi:hypothetical protein
MDLNFKLNKQLKELVIEIDSNDKEKIKKEFYAPQSLPKQILLTIPAIVGWLLHFPLYVPITLVVRNKASDHYDSVVVGLLFLAYPFYLLLVAILLMLLVKNSMAWLSIILLPFSAWSYLQLKGQFC